MADEKEILELIEQAAKEAWTELDLSKRQLTIVPPAVAALTNLTGLNLRENKLTSVPTELTELTNLTILDLSSNQFTKVPLEITTLTNLSYLNLSDNRIRSLPREISNLMRLRVFHIHGNLLTSLPPEISKLSNLTTLGLTSNQLSGVPPDIIKLSNLSDLSLNINRLITLSEEIFRLTNLTRLSLNDTKLVSLPPEIAALAQLTDLDLSVNQLTSLPAEIADLTNLTILDLSSNQFTKVPLEITKLTTLTRLILRGNQLTILPQGINKLINLKRLELGENQLATLPVEITNLINLTYLDLGDNPLPIPPETLADPKDVKAIFAAIAGLKGGERLNEAKMLVVGDGKVGKSSVVEQLIHGTFNPGKQTTLGVEINDEMKVIQSEVKGAGEPVKLNIWDFGGQEIQHSTHQFFLTTRSLYLLVVDARKGNQLDNVEYWLKLIQSFGGDSPIIIVINQIDQLKGQRPLNLDRKALQDKYNIRDFIETSCATGAGIPDLKAAIVREVEQMKHVHDFWPREWLAIKRRLKGMQADYIPVETYLEVCGEENLNDEDLRISLLGLLHDLGTVIRFPGDTEVLNPRWVTQGVYGLLTSEQLVEGQGQFDLNDMGEILDGIPEIRGRYPSYTHQRLIDVMQHFQLCFEFTDRRGHYLIPRHLHDNELDIVWDDVAALRFQYHYVETLPDSIISRFIVRMNQYIQEHHYWKNGVFLHSGENQAKIKADLVDRKIFISIIGKEQTRRAFLAVIRSAFDEINSNFKIEIKQMIPVPGAPQILVSYQDLLAYEEMNEPQIVIPELRKRLAVSELLDGVEDLSIRIQRRERDLTDKRFPQRIPEETKAKPHARILRVVVASPGDVQAERNVLPSVLEELNSSIAVDRRVRLELSRWETDTYPGFHAEGPQGLIDPILKISACDVLIGIFWKRFGTPTSDGKTGTEHELTLAYEAWKEKGSPQIFVYFNQRAYTPKSKSETEQWGQVLEFKDKFPKEGLWWSYRGKAQFEKQIRNHLTNYIRSLD